VTSRAAEIADASEVRKERRMRAYKPKKLKRVHGLHFAPDGLTCAAAGTNGRVVVWDVDA
jgi:hypothetical protein